MPKRRGKQKINTQKIFLLVGVFILALAINALGQLIQLSIVGKQVQAATSPGGSGQPPLNTLAPTDSFTCSNPSPVNVYGDPNNPRSIAIDNGIVRVTYPQLASGVDQKGAMMLERKNSSGVWTKMLGDWYGDWTYFGVSVVTDSVRANIITNSPDFVEVAFEFNHRLDIKGNADTHGYTPPWWNTATQGACTKANGCGCYMEGCGMLDRDFDGTIISPNKYIHSVKFVKTIGVKKCAPGYFVGYHTDPPVVGSWIDSDPNTASAGERESGLGWVSSVTFASNGTVVRNPEAGGHKSLGIIESGGPGPWWFASLELPSNNFPYVLYVAEEHPLPSYVWQFDPTQQGIPLVYKMNPQIGPDGRPKRYQTFIGALPYQMLDRNSEPTPAVKTLIQGNLPAVWPK